MLPSLAAAALAAFGFSRVAEASALGELRALVTADAPPPVPPARAVAPAEGPAEPPIAEPVEKRFWETGDPEDRASRAEWRRRLRARGGRASFALVSAPDPRRPPLIVVLGVGMNFQDGRALAELDDEHQVAFAVVDEALAIPEAARSAADALERWPAASGPLRIVGHSFGSTIGQLLVQELADRGLIGPGRRFPRVLFVGIEGPWRGVDLPWAAKFPGVGRAARLLKRLPIEKPPTEGSFSVVNRGEGMRRYHALDLPPEVTTHFVTALGPSKTTPRLRHFEPVANWFSAELGQGELERLWKVLREGRAGDWNAYDTWAFGGLVRKQGLQNLARTLRRDADWDAHGWKLRRAALESSTLEEFRARYDSALAEIVDAFHGGHTPFMWEDPEFLPYLRKRLADW